MKAYDDSNIFAKILGRNSLQQGLRNRPRAGIHGYHAAGGRPCSGDPESEARNILDVRPEDLAELTKGRSGGRQGAMRAFGADGVTIQQFNESAGGQVVFHLHVHIIPRWDGVPLKPHTGDMEKPEILAAHAEKLRAGAV